MGEILSQEEIDKLLSGIDILKGKTDTASSEKEKEGPPDGEPVDERAGAADSELEKLSVPEQNLEVVRVAAESRVRAAEGGAERAAKEGVNDVTNAGGAEEQISAAQETGGKYVRAVDERASAAEQELDELSVPAREEGPAAGGEGNAEKQKTPDERIAEARGEYLAAYKEWASLPKKEQKKEEGEVWQKAEAARKKYEEERNTAGKEAYDAKRAELEKLGKPKEAVEAELKTFFAKELFQKYIVGEHEALEKAKVESWPPKEKGLFRKAMQWYAKRPAWQRWATSVAIGTGVALFVSPVGIGSAGLIFGGKLLRAAGVGSAGLGINASFGIWNKTLGKEKTKDYRLGQLAERIAAGEFTGTVEEQFAAQSAEYQKILEETAKREKHQKIAQLALTVAAGGSSFLWGGAIDHAIGLKSPAMIVAEAKAASQTATTENLERVHAGIAAKRAAAEAAQQKLELAHQEAAARIEELATIRKGEGISDAVYRQLEDRLGSKPQFGLTAEQVEGAAKVKKALASGKKLTMGMLEKNPAKFGLSHADLESAAKVKGALTRETVHILEKNEKIHFTKDATGHLRIDSDVRIRNVGAHVMLEDDGTIRMTDAKTYAQELGARAGGATTNTFEEFNGYEYEEAAPPAAGPTTNTFEEFNGYEYEEGAPPSAGHGMVSEALKGAAGEAVESGKDAVEAPTIAEFAERLEHDAEILDRAHPGFSGLSLTEQERFLKTFKDIAVPNMRAVEHFPGLTDEQLETLRHINKAWGELREVYDKTLKRFWNSIEETGMTRGQYTNTIVKPEVKVGQLIAWTMENPERYQEQFIALKNIISNLRPEPRDFGHSVDEFLRSKVVLNPAARLRI